MSAAMQEGASAPSPPRLKKAPTAFRTISEVSEELKVAQHVLRFWETKFPLIKPLKRGGGRRYYRPADIELLRKIAEMLHVQGFTIWGANKALRENPDLLPHVRARQYHHAPTGGTSGGDVGYRTISAVADELHLPQHVLRYWETRFSQVRPTRRNGGRRYYRPDDIVVLKRIKDLLYTQGLTVEGVQRLLASEPEASAEG